MLWKLAVWLFRFSIKVTLKTKTFLWDYFLFYIPGALTVAYYVDRADKRRRGCWKGMCGSLLFWKIFPWVFSIRRAAIPTANHGYPGASPYLPLTTVTY